MTTHTNLVGWSLSFQKTITPYLDIIRNAEVTNSLERSPKTLIQVRHEDPREIRVQDEQTGASKCKAPGADCSASSKANLSVPKNVAKGKAYIFDASTCVKKVIRTYMHGKERKSR